MLFVVRYFFKKKQFFNTEIPSSPPGLGARKVLTLSQLITPAVAYLSTYLPDNLIGAAAQTHEPLRSLHVQTSAPAISQPQVFVNHDIVNNKHIGIHGLTVTAEFLAESAQREQFAITCRAVKLIDIILTATYDGIGHAGTHLQLPACIAAGNTLEIGNLFHNRTF